MFELIKQSTKYSNNDNTLQLSSIIINEDYRQQWNINRTLHDFLFLTRNGNLVSETLYRTGAFRPNLNNDYFILLKHIEATYPDNITTDSKRKNHLEDRWCILNKFGEEKVVFDQFKHPNLVDGSCIYSIDCHYYNIETGYFYCNSSYSLNSDEFLFLGNYYDKDKSKRGVLKINKKDGSFELFPSKR